MKNAFRLIHIFFLSALYSCSGPELNYIVNDGLAQGTTYHIVYHEKDNRDLSFQISEIFSKVDKSLSLYDSTSLISAINRGDTIIPDSIFLQAWDHSMDVYKRSGGTFNPAMKPLTDYWGFLARENDSLFRPDSSEIDSLHNLSGPENFILIREKNQPVKMVAKVSGAGLDLNGIAQGFTVDIIAEMLGSNNVKDYLVEVGGEMRAAGRFRNKAWSVGIDDPSGKKGDIIATVRLENISVSTSGTYRKYIFIDGKKYSHIIDPSTGFPVQNEMVSVTVLEKNCYLADAFTKVFMILGPEKSRKLAEKNNLRVYFLYKGNDGRLNSYISKNLQPDITEKKS